MPQAACVAPRSRRREARRRTARTTPPRVQVERKIRGVDQIDPDSFGLAALFIMPVVISASRPTLFTRNATSLAAATCPDLVLTRSRSRWTPLLNKNVFNAA